MWAKILRFEGNVVEDNTIIIQRNMNIGNNLSFTLEPRKAMKKKSFFNNLKNVDYH